MNILKTEIVKAKFITMTTLEGTRRYKNLEEHISEFRTNGGAPLLKFMGFLFHFYLEDNYNIVMVSATYHHESAIGIHTSPPSPPHPSVTTAFPVLDSKFPLTVYFTYDNVYVSMLLSQNIPPSPSQTVSKSLSFMSVSPLMP